MFFLGSVSKQLNSGFFQGGELKDERLSVEACTQRRTGDIGVASASYLSPFSVSLSTNTLFALIISNKFSASCLLLWHFQFLKVSLSSWLMI